MSRHFLATQVFSPRTAQYDWDQKTVFAVGTDGELYRWRGSSMKPEEFKSAVKKPKQFFRDYWMIAGGTEGSPYRAALKDCEKKIWSQASES
jgi:hypothetical protein